ncbi:unnamed protein product [Amoebophrya sp. A120]|nr:unnamed protein product [Amoebophrya sp. A120]|eukprot:GSA120T00024274001.1
MVELHDVQEIGNEIMAEGPQELFEELLQGQKRVDAANEELQRVWQKLQDRLHPCFAGCDIQALLRDTLKEASSAAELFSDTDWLFANPGAARTAGHTNADSTSESTTASSSSRAETGAEIDAVSTAGSNNTGTSTISGTRGAADAGILSAPGPGARAAPSCWQWCPSCGTIVPVLINIFTLWWFNVKVTHLEFFLEDLHLKTFEACLTRP